MGLLYCALIIVAAKHSAGLWTWYVKENISRMLTISAQKLQCIFNVREGSGKGINVTTTPLHKVILINVVTN